jgi:type IV pilus assembly protein PilB
VGSFQTYGPKGCGACLGTGYKGRVGLFEVLELSAGIRDLVAADATPGEIRRQALEEGLITLRMSGLEKVRAGVTSLEEVLSRE